MPGLKSFHGIFGNVSLKELDAVIFAKRNIMKIRNSIDVKIFQLISNSVNSINIYVDYMSDTQKQQMNSIVAKHKKLSMEPDAKLTCTSKVVATIRTNSDTPVYTKFYSYPSSLKGEVEKQVKQMLEAGIIRPSRSPYNSPVWIVAKKPDSLGNKKYRLVIDYRKLNSVTISDRYPIPDTNSVIAQLGKNKFYSVIDLKSGFHQIPLKQSDQEKTAFSICNGKFEFLRLPFGLKNAPAIFQRALDDILHEHIGKICYVYIDDVIIFGKTIEEHFENIEKIFKTLEEANLKVQLDKCHFLKEEVEFLGFIISADGVKTNPKKVKAIVDFPLPKSIKQLRSFLGLSGYYRRFIRDYAKIAKPLTSMLRGEEGRMSKKKSAQIEIKLDSSAIEALNKLKNSLVSKDMILAYPDFDKELELTTDASDYALGAVLSQGDKPIAFISRTLNKAEEHYAPNEKELLAIVWSLNTLRNYLYGQVKIKIYTDHQPLTGSMNAKNNNSKMKRWKAFLEEYNYEMFYKRGKANVVVDALSRNPAETSVNTLSIATNSDDSSSHNLILHTDTPINAFKNQLFINLSPESSYKFEIIFPTYHKHTICEPDYNLVNLVAILKRYLNPSVINCIKTDESIMGMIQDAYRDHFRNYRIRFSYVLVQNVTNEQEQTDLILSVHKRAHRCAKENRMQILENYYFPTMSRKIKNIISQCSICKESKYERHPNKPELKYSPPIPEYPGHIVHVDIFQTENKSILTAIDKFSKFVQVKMIQSRAIEDIKEPLRELLFYFGVPKVVVLDNEKTFNSASISFMLKDQLQIDVFQTPPYKSTVNGQIERFHSTLGEIMRCLKKENPHRTFQELLDSSVYAYNYSVHSVTKKRPIEVFFGRTVSTDPRQFDAARIQNINRLKHEQKKAIDYHNKNRHTIKNYNPGDVIYVKIHQRIGTKTTPRYKKEIVETNNSTTVKTQSGRLIHKSYIRN